MDFEEKEKKRFVGTLSSFISSHRIRNNARKLSESMPEDVLPRFVFLLQAPRPY